MDINEKKHSQTKQNYYKKKTQGTQHGKHEDHRPNSGEEHELITRMRIDRSQRWNGTDKYYKHLFGLLYTDGVKAHAEIAHAYWLIDSIASWQFAVTKNYHEHQGWMVWKLDVKDGRALLTARVDDDDDDPFVKQKIEFTDHPAGQWEFWQEGEVLILPEEH